ncbi:MAG: nucleotidyl transferase AbiEii/AbiGii toxin family protein [bacterium]|nr:nucleotidyl transferase AbiEii/AbiGii toxin family protein [bacterium]
MTKQPTRATAAGRAYLDLRKLARERRRPTAELLQLYALEGFLTRLPQTRHARRFVLKGGVLLAAFDTRRPTKDIDLAAAGLANDPETVRAAIVEVLEIEVEDGLVFDLNAVQAHAIREDEIYGGVRVTIPCRLETARLDFHADVNIGDPIEPAPSVIPFPRILGGEPLRVTGYPVTMVLSEKIVTAVQRGSANSRWRDFADIASLARRHPIDGAELRRAIRTVAEYRQVTLQPLRQVLAGFAELAQPKWATWRRRLGLDALVPESFADLLEEVIAFADPSLAADTVDAKWNPADARWE